MGEVFSFLISLAIISGSFVIGGWCIIIGQISLAIREIAINTRGETNAKSRYIFLDIVAYIISVFGIIILLGGLLIGLIGIFTPSPVQ